MIRRISIIAFASILLSFCAVLTVKDVGDGSYYVEGVLADGALERAEKFCAEKNKKFVAIKVVSGNIFRDDASIPSVLFKCQ